MAGVFMRFASGRAGSSGTHARYITRPPATERDMDALLTRHYPEEVRDAGDYGALRDQVEEYCRQQEDDELARPRRGGGETRTHYRLVLSFEERVDTREARDLADAYLERTFPNARVLAAVHQDTEHTHVHVHLQARDIDDHKLHFDRHAYERLDEQWAEVYAREYGPEKLEEHLERKAATREWRQRAALAHERGEERPPAPERAGHRWSREDGERREERHYGHDHESRTGDDQRGVADREPDATGGEHVLERSLGAADEAVRAVADLRDQGERTDEEAGAAVHTAEAFAGGVRGADRDEGAHDDRLVAPPDRDDDRGR
jgi:hypothetical protein